jgi:hypothetical protein
VARSSPSRTGRLYPQECSRYSFSLGAESTPGPWYGQKEMSLKISVTPPGIDPGTVRLVAQRLNHYAPRFVDPWRWDTAVLQNVGTINKLSSVISQKNGNHLCVRLATSARDQDVAVHRSRNLIPVTGIALTLTDFPFNCQPRSGSTNGSTSIWGWWEFGWTDVWGLHPECLGRVG